MLFLAFLTQKLAPSRALNAIIFGIDEQCNLIFETALLTNCKIYIIFLFRWDPLSFLLSLFLSLSLSTSLPPNPWLICDWPQISHQPSSRRPKASKPWWPTMSNGPMATHAIWTNPQPHMRFEVTHGNPRWSEPTHGNLNPNHHQPTTIWIPRLSEAYKPILRERRSFHCERKRGESVMGLLVGLLVVAMVEVFFFFLLWLVVVSGCGGCGWMWMWRFLSAMIFFFFFC